MWKNKYCIFLSCFLAFFLSFFLSFFPSFLPFFLLNQNVLGCRLTLALTDVGGLLDGDVDQEGCTKDGLSTPRSQVDRPVT